MFVGKTFNTTIPLYFTVIQYSFTTFELQESLGSTCFPKGYLFRTTKRLSGLIISLETMTGE